MNEDKYQLDISFFLSLFLREAPCSCVSVCDCTHVLPQFSGVAVVSSPPSLNLVNQPGTPRTWRCNRCDSHDHLFDWYRQNKYASLCLKLDIFTLVENIALMTVVNSLTSGQHFIFSK